MSDLDRHQLGPARPGVIGHAQQGGVPQAQLVPTACLQEMDKANARRRAVEIRDVTLEAQRARLALADAERFARRFHLELDQRCGGGIGNARHSVCPTDVRSEEHTSELQSLMRNSYAVFCLKKKIKA